MPSVLDLLAEAEVFAKYGLEEKALDRIAGILAREPDHLAARCLEVEVLLKLRDDQRLAPAVARAAELSRELGDQDQWSRVQHRLERAGYTVSDGRLEAPVATTKKPDRIADLLGEIGLAATPKARRPAADASVDALLGGLGVPKPKPALYRNMSTPTRMIKSAILILRSLMARLLITNTIPLDRTLLKRWVLRAHTNMMTTGT